MGGAVLFSAMLAFLSPQITHGVLHRVEVAAVEVPTHMAHVGGIEVH